MSFWINQAAAVPKLRASAQLGLFAGVDEGYHEFTASAWLQLAAIANLTQNFFGSAEVPLSLTATASLTPEVNDDIPLRVSTDGTTFVTPTALRYWDGAAWVDAGLKYSPDGSTWA